MQADTLITVLEDIQLILHPCFYLSRDQGTVLPKSYAHGLRYIFCGSFVLLSICGAGAMHHIDPLRTVIVKQNQGHALYAMEFFVPSR